MEGVLAMIRHAENRAVKEQPAQGQDILEELREVSRQLRCTDRWFDMECDSDLIDACIYQREALSARYRYLMTRAKQQELTVSPFL